MRVLAINTLAALAADGRGGDLGGVIGIVVIVLGFLLAAALLVGAALVLIRRSRGTASRAGPERQPHRPGHTGRVR